MGRLIQSVLLVSIHYLINLISTKLIQSLNLTQNLTNTTRFDDRLCMLVLPYHLIISQRIIMIINMDLLYEISRSKNHDSNQKYIRRTGKKHGEIGESCCSW